MDETTEREQSEKIRLRLKKSAGQLAGSMKMMDEDRSCEEVLVQLSAVKSGIDKAMKLVIAQNIRQSIDTIDEDQFKSLQHSLDLLLKTR